MSVNQIANQYETSYSNMWEKLNEFNLKTEIMVNGRPTKCPSKEELEKLKYLPKTQIAKMYRVSDKTIKKWFIKYGIEDSYEQKIPIPPKEELESRIHMTTVEISEEYNVSVTTVLRWFKSYDLTLDTQIANISKIPPKEELEALKNLPYRDIVEKYGVEHTTVIRWFKKYGIKKS